MLIVPPVPFWATWTSRSPSTVRPPFGTFIMMLPPLPSLDTAALTPDESFAVGPLTLMVAEPHVPRAPRAPILIALVCASRL